MSSLEMLDRSEILVPTQDEAEVARESSHQLARLLADLELAETNKHDDREPVRIEIHLEGDHEVVSLPGSALQLLNVILAHMAQGHMINIVPSHYELTTQQAADLLNVSRPFLIGLLESNQIPYHKVGTHRRIRFNDLMDYKNEYEKQREAALDELAKEAQEWGIGY